MSAIHVSTTIKAPLERVFAVFADLEGAADVIEGIMKLEILTDGPVGVGTRWRETRLMFKKEATEEMEITAFDPPNGYKVEAQSHGSQYLSEFKFTPKDDGVEAVMSFEAKPLTLMARIMGFIMAPMMRGFMVKCLEKDLDDLKRHLEQGDAPPAAEPN